MYPYTLRNKGTKAVTGAVPFQKVHFRYKHVPFEKVLPQWQLLYLYFWECILFDVK